MLMGDIWVSIILAFVLLTLALKSFLLQVLEIVIAAPKEAAGQISHHGWELQAFVVYAVVLVFSMLFVLVREWNER